MDKKAIRNIVDQIAPSWQSTVSQISPFIELPLIGDNPLSIIFEAQQIDKDSVVDIVHNLTQLSHSVREELGTSLYAAYLNSVEECSVDFESAQHQLDWESDATGIFENPVEPKSAADIWALVQFRSICVRRNDSKTRTIAILSGECAWDGEHGIALFFEDGLQFIKAADVNAHIE